MQTIERAFAKVYTDRANIELVKLDKDAHIAKFAEEPRRGLSSEELAREKQIVERFAQRLYQASGRKMKWKKAMRLARAEVSRLGIFSANRQAFGPERLSLSGQRWPT